MALLEEVSPEDPEALPFDARHGTHGEGEQHDPRHPRRSLIGRPDDSGESHDDQRCEHSALQAHQFLGRRPVVVEHSAVGCRIKHAGLGVVEGWVELNPEVTSTQAGGELTFLRLCCTRGQVRRDVQAQEPRVLPVRLR